MEGVTEWLKLETEFNNQIFPTLYECLCRYFKYFEFGNLNSNEIFYPKLFKDYYEYVLYIHIRTILDSLKRINQNIQLLIKEE
jgi:hypothetical protein